MLSNFSFGQHGIRRLIDTLVITASCIVTFQAIYRGLYTAGLFEGGGITYYFEGFSNNRNAFAYQLIICSILIVSFSRKNERLSESIKKNIQDDSFFKNVGLYRDNVFCVLHGIIICGIVLTGSRAGIITELIVVIFALIFGVVSKTFLIRSFTVCLFSYICFVIIVPWIATIIAGESLIFYWRSLFESDVSNFLQTKISYPQSNIERWNTIIHGIDLWKESPIIGVGLGVFIEQSTQWFTRPIVIHSTPVWLLVEFGLVGLLSFLIMISYCIVLLIKTKKINSYHYSALLLFLSFIVFGLPHEIFNQRLFWLALGICLALPFDSRTGNESDRC